MDLTLQPSEGFGIRKHLGSELRSVDVDVLALPIHDGQSMPKLFEDLGAQCMVRFVQMLGRSIGIPNQSPHGAEHAAEGALARCHAPGEPQDIGSCA